MITEGTVFGIKSYAWEYLRYLCFMIKRDTSILNTCTTYLNTDNCILIIYISVFICISNTFISVLNTDINMFCITSSSVFICEFSHLMQIYALGILISKFRNKIGISVFQKEISLSKMDISVLQIDIFI